MKFEREALLAVPANEVPRHAADQTSMYADTYRFAFDSETSEPPEGISPERIHRVVRTVRGPGLANMARAALHFGDVGSSAGFLMDQEVERIALLQNEGTVVMIRRTADDSPTRIAPNFTTSTIMRTDKKYTSLIDVHDACTRINLDEKLGAAETLEDAALLHAAFSTIFDNPSISPYPQKIEDILMGGIRKFRVGPEDRWMIYDDSPISGKLRRTLRDAGQDEQVMAIADHAAKDYRFMYYVDQRNERARMLEFQASHFNDPSRQRQIEEDAADIIKRVERIVGNNTGKALLKRGALKIAFAALGGVVSDTIGDIADSVSDLPDTDIDVAPDTDVSVAIEVDPGYVDLDVSNTDAPLQDTPAQGVDAEVKFGDAEVATRFDTPYKTATNHDVGSDAAGNFIDKTTGEYVDKTELT